VEIGRLTLICLVVAAVVPTGGSARTNPQPVVPRRVQVQIASLAPLLAYAPTREPIGFGFTGWLKTPATVEITLDNKAGWEIRFVARRHTGSCRVGMEKSYQLDGNKVYWSHTGAEQQAWRCLTDGRGRQVRLVASSPQPPSLFAAVGLGRVVASGKRIAV
jgi:hypothetical protein